MKKIIIYLLIIIILLGSFYSILYYKNNYKKTETKLKNEINTIYKLNQDREKNYDKINEKLNRRITKGEYLKVEDAIKSYLIDLYNYIDNLNFIIQDGSLDYLSIENIKEDKPLFTNSIKNIKEKRAQINDNIEKLVTQATDNEKILSYLKNKDNKKNLKLYKSFINQDPEQEKSIRSTYSTYLLKLELYEKALNFLINNVSEWSIRNNNILFKKTSISEEYTAIIEEINQI